MTTINNSHLIEKVGGIERAIALEAMLQKHAVPEGWKISIINGMWHRSSIGFTHNDLRTAIAEHDREFKVGDKYVMLKISHSELITVNEGDIEQPWWNTRIIRHATPSEIKAGHRLEAERHG